MHISQSIHSSKQPPHLTNTLPDQAPEIRDSLTNFVLAVTASIHKRGQILILQPNIQPLDNYHTMKCCQLKTVLNRNSKNGKSKKPSTMVYKLINSKHSTARTITN